MRQILPIVATMITLLYMTSCTKTNDAGGGAPIATDADARAAFAKINSLYTSKLRSKLTKSAQTFTNYVLIDSAGQKVIANGKYSTSSFSGSSGSSSSYDLDVTVSFQQFRSGDLQLDGILRIYDYSSTRTDCSSSGCATATHKNLIYSTTDTTAAAAIAIKFANNGKNFSDKIILRGSKPYSTFSVIMNNAKGEKFAFSY